MKPRPTDILPDAIAASVIETLRGYLTDPEKGLVSGRLYRADEIAERWGMDRNRVYEIEESRLPRVRTGPRGGNVRFRGIDVLRFEAGLKPLNHAEILDRHPGPRVVSLGSGKKRIA